MFTMTVSLTGAFLFCFVSLGHSYPMIRGKAPGTNSLTHGGHKDNVTGLADRCTDDGFGAITLDDNGVMHFFRGDYVWTGFHGSAQYINETWEGLTAPVDAAIRISNKKQPLQHQRTYIFKASSVWSFFDGRLVDGFPRLISQEFPGIPDNLDAAVECHEGECKTDSVIFFKGDTVYVYSPLEVPQVKQRQWLGLCPCSAAVRWMERYYCFKGTNFTRFDPVSGHRLSNRSLDTRDYFMNCPGRGHRHVAQQNATLMAITNRCSNQTFRAFSSDDKGRTYAFRGGWYFRLDSRVDGWHPWPVSHAWRNLQGEVDAAFSWENKMYIIQGSQVSIYLSDQVYTPVQGYPKSLQEELGVTKVDAAFTCPHSSKLYVIKGNMIHEIDLKQSPRVPGLGRPIAQSHVDSAMCNVNGLYLFYGPIFYQYKNVEQLVASTELPKPGNLTANFFEC